MRRAAALLSKATGGMDVPAAVDVAGLSAAGVQALLGRLAEAHPEAVAAWRAAAPTATAAAAAPSAAAAAPPAAAAPAAGKKRARPSPLTPVAGSPSAVASSPPPPAHHPPGSIVVPGAIVAASKLQPVVPPPSARGFDMSRFRLRHVALHVAYLGGAYAGFSAQEGPSGLADGIVGGSGDGDGGGNGGSGKAPKRQQPAAAAPQPPIATVEAALFAALQQACLIEGREWCGYTRCGRTDRGVSAGGQVLALRLRSKAKRGGSGGSGAAATSSAATAAAAAAATAPTPPCVPSMWRRLDPATGQPLDNGDAADAAAHDDSGAEPFPPPGQEHDYAAILNGLLPRDVRVLGWADVPPDFSARFSCTARVYRYYFPGRGLDVAAMRRAAAVLSGVHDFRNVARIDIGNTQNFVRALASLRVVAVDEGAPAARRAAVAAGGGAPGADASTPLLVESHSVPVPLAGRVAPYAGPARTAAVVAEEVAAAAAAGSSSSASSASVTASATGDDATLSSPSSLPHPAPPAALIRDLLAQQAPNQQLDALDAAADAGSGSTGGGSGLYYLQVTGNAFLWHQVRCIAALLFHVGRGYEPPDTLAWLLDVAACPARPQYAMAPEGPLVLYHCGFGEEGPEGAPPVPPPPQQPGQPAAAAASASAMDEDGDGDAAPGPLPRRGVSPRDASPLLDAAAAPGGGHLYKPTRFRRSHPGLYGSMHHSVPSLRKVTSELEGAWSGLAVQAAMVRGLLDRIYALPVDAADVHAWVTGKGVGSGGGDGGGGGGKKTKKSGAAAEAGDNADAYSPFLSPAPAPAVGATTMTWGDAVARCSAAASRADPSVTRPLLALEDAEMFIQGLPALATAAGAHAQLPPGATLPPPHAGVPTRGRGGYTPLAGRPTGMSVGDKWRQLSDAQRAAVTAMHPVNATRLAAELAAASAAASSSSASSAPAAAEEAAGAPAGPAAGTLL